jgi:hypothetical protein
MSEGMKKCKLCGVIKLLSDFTPAKSSKDGRCNHCKKCRSFYQADYQRGPEGRLVSKKANKKYVQKYPEKKHAHNIIKYEIESGRLMKAKFFYCFRCGKEAKHYHHPDYNFPLSVQPVCVKCHREIHKTETRRSPFF